MDSDIEESVNDLGYAMQALRDEPSHANYDAAIQKSMDIEHLIDEIPFMDEEEIIDLDTEDWWKQHLDCFKSEGQKDAELGVFDPPHSGSDDPQDEDENAAYKRGFDERRTELGDKFEWE